ncbi:MAG TPA: hypothetical protein VIS48_00795 [Candidatus Kryptonia bacterium]
MLFRYVAASIIIWLASVFYNASDPAPQQARLDEVSFYLPLKIGNTWTYNVEGILNGMHTFFQLRVRINDTLRHSDGSLLFSHGEYFNEEIRGDSLKQYVTGYYTIRDRTIYNYNSASDSDLYHRPTYAVPLLKAPLAVGNEWEYDRDERVSSYRIASIGQLTFRGTPIDSVVLVVGHWSDVVDSSWYAPGIGLLKECVGNSKDFRKVSTLQDFRVTK